MVKLIVHAGFPKCGSTSVFSALKANLARRKAQARARKGAADTADKKPEQDKE